LLLGGIFVPAAPLATAGADTAAAADTGPSYVTLSFGRAQWVTADGCVALPNTITLGAVAAELDRRGLSGVGNIVVGRTAETSHYCYKGWALHMSWDDVSAFETAYGWRFNSASMSYRNMTTLSTSEQYEESCGSLPTFTAHSAYRAWGMFDYPNNKSDLTIQSSIVSRCFAYGRSYLTWGTNIRSEMADPWFQRTNSLKGGSCRDVTRPCYLLKAHGGTRYQSPVKLASWINDAPDQWVVLQAYRFVTGWYQGTQFSWNCTNSDWQAHWTSHTELYCWNDYLRVLDAIPPTTIVTDPGAVATAWGRTADLFPPP
jgi:hypothetical protein